MRIVAVAGASGGHIFPAVAFIQAAGERHRDCSFKLVLPERRVEADLSGIDAEYLGIGPLRRAPLSAMLGSLYRLSRGAFRSLRILLDFKPDIVVGFGSLPSVPMVFLAWLMRIKTVVHEQNAVPGKANLFLSRFADRIAVSFEESRRMFPSAKRTVYTGNPLRTAMRRIPRGEARAALGLSADVFTVLAAGGSQGSAVINRHFADAVRLLAPALKMQVIHISGAAEAGQVAAAYAGCGVPAKVFPFLVRMELAYSAADVAVCRAGATTCAELMFYALPALVIPYPFAYGHQSANAAALEKKGLVAVVAEQGLDAGKIREFLRRCAEEPAFLSRMRQGAATTGPDTAAQRLAAACLEVLK